MIRIFYCIYATLCTRKRMRYRNFSFSSTRPRIPKCYRPRRWKRYPCPAIWIRWLLSCSNLHDVIITFNCCIQYCSVTNHCHLPFATITSWLSIVRPIECDTWQDRRKQIIKIRNPCWCPMIVNKFFMFLRRLYFTFTWCMQLSVFIVFIKNNDSHYSILLWHDRLIYSP